VGVFGGIASGTGGTSALKTSVKSALARRCDFCRVSAPRNSSHLRLTAGTRPDSAVLWSGSGLSGEGIDAARDAAGGLLSDSDDDDVGNGDSEVGVLMGIRLTGSSRSSSDGVGGWLSSGSSRSSNSPSTSLSDVVDVEDPLIDNLRLSRFDSADLGGAEGSARCVGAEDISSAAPAGIAGKTSPKPENCNMRPTPSLNPVVSESMDMELSVLARWWPPTTVAEPGGTLPRATIRSHFRLSATSSASCCASCWRSSRHFISFCAMKLSRSACLSIAQDKCSDGVTESDLKETHLSTRVRVRGVALEAMPWL